MATNRIESLDPALIRPGRIDRKIEFPLPDTKTKRRIFNIHTSRMTLAPDVNLEEFIMAKVGLWKHGKCSISGLCPAKCTCARPKLSSAMLRECKPRPVDYSLFEHQGAISLILMSAEAHRMYVQDELSGADIKAACTEAGLLALRERRMRVTHADFKKAKEKVLYKKKEGVPEGLYL